MKKRTYNYKCSTCFSKLQKNGYNLTKQGRRAKRECSRRDTTRSVQGLLSICSIQANDLQDDTNRALLSRTVSVVA